MSSVFDELLENIKQTLIVPEFLTVFEKLTTEEERAAEILKIPEVKELTISPSFTEKNDTRSEDLKRAGDESVEDNDMETALHYYTNALKFASLDSQIIPSILVSRSEVLCSLQHYTSASKEVQRALCYQVPTEYLIRLLVVKGDCLCKTTEYEEAEKTYMKALETLRLSSLANEQKAKLTVKILTRLKEAKKNIKKNNESPFETKEEEMIGIPHVDYGINVNFPSASSMLQLAWSEEKGRHMIAKQDIEMGSVIIVEQPYAWALSPDSTGSHCNYCCIKIKSPVPCKKCCTVVFCSDECREVAVQQYHQYECVIFGHIIFSDELSPMSLIVYRILVTLLAKYLVYNSDTKEKVCDLSHVKNLCAGLATTDPKSVNLPFLSKEYSSVYTQATNTGSRKMSDIFKRTLSAAFLAKCLQFNINFSDEDIVFVTSLISRHLQSCSCNAYQITDYEYEGDNIKSIQGFEIGGAVYPTLSLCNHSCVPNVTRNSYGRICVVRTLQPIRKGEEILDNYGPHFLIHNKEQRQKRLKGQYRFDCTCKACVGDWPEAGLLPKYTISSNCVKCFKDKGDASLNTCPHCKYKFTATKIKGKIQTAEYLYKCALDLVLQRKIIEAQKLLLQCAQVMHDHTRYPNKQSINCEQAIELCNRVLSDNYHKAQQF